MVRDDLAAFIPRTRCRIAGTDAMKRTEPKVIELDTNKLEAILSTQLVHFGVFPGSKLRLVVR